MTATIICSFEKIPNKLQNRNIKKEIINKLMFCLKGLYLYNQNYERSVRRTIV